jgi:hypothetical protein
MRQASTLYRLGLGTRAVIACGLIAMIWIATVGVIAS